MIKRMTAQKQVSFATPHQSECITGRESCPIAGFWKCTLCFVHETEGGNSSPAPQLAPDLDFSLCIVELHRRWS